MVAKNKKTTKKTKKPAKAVKSVKKTKKPAVKKRVKKSDKKAVKKDIKKTSKKTTNTKVQKKDIIGDVIPVTSEVNVVSDEELNNFFDDEYPEESDYDMHPRENNKAFQTGFDEE